jgi:hypothetical protein
MRLLPLVLLLGCNRGRSDSDEAPALVPERPILVYWTIDTLGKRASDEVGYCGFIQERAGAHGVEVACLDGAIPPSSWTGESHLRTLWPNHMAEGLRGTQHPICESASSLETLARSREGSWLFASDNSFSYKPDSEICADGGWGWIQRVDESFLPEENASPRLPEADQPVHEGIGRVLERAASGEAMSVYLNDFHSGGHWPRCWFAPDTEACTALYQYGLDAGLTDGTDPVEDWLDKRFRNNVLNAGYEANAADPGPFRDIVWQTMIESILHFRAEMFEVRLERLLSGLEEADRLDDLVLVVAGDHGENPCVPSLDGTEINCDHARTPTEYTGNVPVFVSPPELADEWERAGFVGDADRVWSLANVSYALMDSFGEAPPADWPEMEPVGRATSWSCLFEFVSAVRVKGDESMRCEGEACIALSWGLPDGAAHEPAPLDTIDAELAAFGQAVGDFPNWAEAACAEDVK